MDIITAKTDRFFLLRYAANSLCNNALATQDVSRGMACGIYFCRNTCRCMCIVFS